MRVYSLIALSICCSFSLFAQVSFEKGYFILNDGNKTECFIKDVDWMNAPASLDYRLTATGETMKVETLSLKEFVVGDTKYVRAQVQYDQSPQELRKTGVTSNPQWADGNLLLKVLVDGKARLYRYNTKEFTLYFFSVNEGPIEQLVFKNYLNPANTNQLVENNLYLTQLNTKVKCGGKPATRRDVPYQQNPLTKYFREYNKCSGDVVTEVAKTKNAFSLRLTPGVDMANTTAHLTSFRDYDFGKRTAFRIGAEAQFALPFNHGKWMIVAEPTYVNFSGDDINKHGSLKYTLLEMPIGVRYRMFLSEKSYLFINGSILLDFPINHTQEIPGFRAASVDKGTYGFAGGAGFAFGRFSIEGRYYPQRERNYTYLTYHYTKTSLILGIRIF